MALRQSSFNRLLQKHGKDCTLSVVTEGVYNPATSTAPNTSEDFIVRCHPVKYNVGDEDRQDVLFGSRMYMVQATDTLGVPIPKPKSGDLISGFGDNCVVVDTNEVYSLGIMAYFCMVKE